MTLIILSVFILASLVFARVNLPRISLTATALALVLVTGIGCGPVPGWLVQALQADYLRVTAPSWGTTSAIVILGAGTERVAETNTFEPPIFEYGRIAKAMELYVACKRHGGRCVLLISGGDPLRNGVSEAAVCAEQARKLGADPADLVLEERSTSTWQNAQFSAPLLGTQHAERVYLVTSGIHLRRSLLYFGHFGVHPTPVRGDHVSAMLSVLPQAYNLWLMDFAVHEYVGVARYYVYEAMGWNVPAMGVGST